MLQQPVPDYAIRVSPRDYLNARVIGVATANDVYLRYEILLDDGTTVQGLEFVNIITADTITTKSVQLTDGWLIRASLQAGSVPVTGQMYGVVDVTKSETGLAGVQVTIVRGYLSSNVAVAWPTSYPFSPEEINAFKGVIAGANPAAGANFAVAIPAYAVFEVSSIHFRLTTSAVAATRTVSVGLDAGAATDPYVEKVCAVNQAESLTYDYNFYHGAQADVLVGTTIMGNFPVKLLDWADRVTITVANIGVADQLSRIYIHGRRWRRF